MADDEHANTENKKTEKKNTVFALSRASRCHACDKKLVRGDIVKLENSKDDTEALCRSCAQLDAYQLVGKGSAKITRLATKYSKVTYVVLQWSDTWKCYERVGILAEPQAVHQAEKESGKA